jgi:ribonuclease HII
VIALFTEAYRLRLLGSLEEEFGQMGFEAVAGVDEAGRGALAGPVVACAYIPRPGLQVPGVDDSKQLSPAKRARLEPLLKRGALAWHVAAVEPPEIDRLNILEATRLAMQRCVRSLQVSPEVVILDAMRLPHTNGPQVSLVRGDAVVYAIACASVLAKVERDRIMDKLDKVYPHYGFAAHKGYGAPEHLAALAHFGPSPEHRLTFRSVLPRSQAVGGLR